MAWAFGVGLTQNQILALIFTSYVTVRKVRNLSRSSPVSSFVIGSNSGEHILEQLQGLRDIAQTWRRAKAQ